MKPVATATFTPLPKVALPRLADPELARLTQLVHGRFPLGWFYRQRYALVVQLLHRRGAILEVGVGAGIFAPTLRRAGDRFVGVDVHAEMAAVATALAAAGAPSPLLRASVEALPFAAASFDVIVAMSVLEHLTPLDAAFQELARVCRPRGELILGIPVKNRLTRALFAALGYDDDRIHPSSHRDILGAAGQAFSLESLRALPSAVPLDVALYVAARFRRR